MGSLAEQRKEILMMLTTRPFQAFFLTIICLSITVDGVTRYQYIKQEDGSYLRIKLSSESSSTSFSSGSSYGEWTTKSSVRKSSSFSSSSSTSIDSSSSSSSGKKTSFSSSSALASSSSSSGSTSTEWTTKSSKSKPSSSSSTSFVSPPSSSTSETNPSESKPFVSDQVFLDGAKQVVKNEGSYDKYDLSNRNRIIYITTPRPRIQLFN